MTLAHIPRWVGPVATPILLIIFIAVFCCYYCYWKPKKLRKKAENSSKIGKTSVSKQTTKPCQVKYVDEMYYYSYNAADCPYGPFYTDICPIQVPNSPVYCRPNEYKPRKVFYYTKKNAERSAVRPCRTPCPNTANGKQKCQVKCQKGQCLKWPNLPIIVEGDSAVEEEESENVGNEEMECLQSANGIVVECEKGSESNKGSSNDVIAVGHDSGYED